MAGRTSSGITEDPLYSIFVFEGGPDLLNGGTLHARGGAVPVIQTVEEVEASLSVLDEHATETQLARILGLVR
jgi:hypothetical protein